MSPQRVGSRGRVRAGGAWAASVASASPIRDAETIEAVTSREVRRHAAAARSGAVRSRRHEPESRRRSSRPRRRAGMATSRHAAFLEGRGVHFEIAETNPWEMSVGLADRHIEHGVVDHRRDGRMIVLEEISGHREQAKRGPLVNRQGGHASHIHPDHRMPRASAVRMGRVVRAFDRLHRMIQSPAAIQQQSATRNQTITVSGLDPSSDHCTAMPPPVANHTRL